MNADYHLHCEFSDDSREPAENQIRRALELGLNELCFTDHVDYGIKKDWSEGNILYRTGDPALKNPELLEPMANVDYPKYFAQLKNLREKYRGKIAVKLGLEFGIQVSNIYRYEKLFADWQADLDFILLSIHQVDNLELWSQDYQSGKTQAEYNEGYYNEMLGVVKKFKNYSVLAHLDMIKRYDLAGEYPFAKVRDTIAEILKTVIADGKGIELNTSSWHYKLPDTTPSREILKLYKDLGGKIITLGSDAHSTIYLADHMADAKNILKNEIGFKTFCTFDKMQPIFHEI